MKNNVILPNEFNRASTSVVSENNPLNYINILDSEMELIVNKYRPFPLAKWQFTEIFNLYSEAVIKVKNIQYPENISMELVPLTEALKNQIYLDQIDIDDYYFIFSKRDFVDYILPKSDVNLFFAQILKKDAVYSLFIQLMTYDYYNGGGDDPITNGVRIPNPPVKTT